MLSKQSQSLIWRLLLVLMLLLSAAPVAQAQEVMVNPETLPGDLAGNPVLRSLDEPLPDGLMAATAMTSTLSSAGHEFTEPALTVDGLASDALMLMDPTELVEVHNEEFMISERDFVNPLPEEELTPEAAGKVFLPLVQNGDPVDVAGKGDLVSAAAGDGGMAASSASANPNATGDFNGDGYSDLAIGTPGEKLNDQPFAGVVNVIYGTAQGLSAVGNQLLTQAAHNPGAGIRAYDLFGSTVAAGDFNGDGYDDLAAGAPGEDYGALDAGAVNIFYGSAQGLLLTGSGTQIWYQNQYGILGAADNNDNLGAALAVGDFNADGYADLAIGVPGENVSGLDAAGAVNLIYGSAAGLTHIGNQVWHQDVGNVADKSEKNDRFGQALAAGNIDGKEGDELVVGIPQEAIGSKKKAGAVQLFFGRSGSGLAVSGNRLIHQDTEGILGAAEEGDQFGFSLAMGNFNGDGYPDLAIGVPFENPGQTDSTRAAGAVNVIYGLQTGLTTLNNQVWHQDSPNFHDFAEVGDTFGRSLVTGDFNKDGRGDLAIGVPGQSANGIDRVGVAHTLYGSNAGLTVTGARYWFEQGIHGTLNAQPYDAFSSTLYAGDYNGDGQSDLGFGIPGMIINGKEDAGAVVVIYHIAGSWTWALWHQDSPGILEEAEPVDRFSDSFSN